MYTLINPNLIVQKSDPFTTGIVYMPIGLAYFAAVLRQNKIKFGIIDAFGEAPQKSRFENGFVIRGLTTQDVVDKIAPQTKAFFLYAINLASHYSTIEIAKRLKQSFPKIPIIVFENTQAVTAYSLKAVQKDFYSVGVDYVLTGEVEEKGLKFVGALEKNGSSEELHTLLENDKQIEDLDKLPFPAWDLFPLQNYWNLRYAHGPFETKRYLPLLTSRGCPYPCRFCVIPETNNQKWRARSAENVVAEMEWFQKTLGVSEFHIEDVNPTINDERIQTLCQKIVEKKLKIIWKIAAGTKVESIKSEKTIEWMAKAGCRYISISPESGSPKIMQKIQKPFNIGHATQLVKAMNHFGIFSQACFVLGFPGEDDEDRKQTINLARLLTKAGIDEIAQFIITPVPGSKIYNEFSGFKNYSELTFSPSWRRDYKKLAKFRFRLYRRFLLWKLLYHPQKILRQIMNFLKLRFETKMEMTPYRALKTWGLILKARRI
ncbi:MAG: hypothetical protein A3F82_05230 [Deltaproteobacteria bacterium RIFCSPLOWO2_12_FULL_44_12]|nr:MAG: hypothetical protein A2712_02080 [Deltaproteobacteria bacterium RIFCSPHIGHO2_01_FULL_43_49]OGQ15087.1 MAG: hypothetical protein A3D22_03400 [Deltaproteobacteria bacterium RIFCSPHIGHO2_02_FULL_44_53]OGQ27293.1 MAG: hypothetical protein A3D98_02675 [Deltaproteobacteria bacterium RIFCSPHIGHO2_12_FULL_44_21]OGQ31604.1 MAG: hypothetical protein A2979_04560 [Deltaproteobacteria bacterium RIFCSPLOWO2_01_FULL_45_74]OGQ42804.1 MAG: hypothetical protein A3I70_06865 [Deltaproteobacteria bacterium 